MLDPHHEKLICKHLFIAFQVDSSREKKTENLDLELQVASKKEISGFKNLFYARTATKLGEKHLWLSLFTRPPHNPFTRAQRLACCISILFAAMVTNAMFYNFGTPPGDAVQVGPLKSKPHTDQDWHPKQHNSHSCQCACRYYLQAVKSEGCR